MSKPDQCDKTSRVVQPKQKGPRRITRSDEKNCWQQVQPTKQLQESKEATWRQNVLERRSSEGGGASPVPSASPTPTSPALLPGPVDVGGVSAAVDVAVGLQAVLRRSHHVGGFHRRPGEQRLRPALRTVAIVASPFTCTGSGRRGRHSLHEDDDVVHLDAGHGAEGAAGGEKSRRLRLVCEAAALP